MLQLVLRQTILLVAAGLILQSPLSPQDNNIIVPNGFGLGRDFVEKDSEHYMSPMEQVMYARGFVNGLYASSGLLRADRGRMKMLKDCIVGMTDTQVRAILEKAIRDKPEQWHQGLVILGMVAIGQACKFFPIPN